MSRAWGLRSRFKLPSKSARMSLLAATRQKLQKRQMPGFNLPLNVEPENLVASMFTSDLGFPNALDEAHHQRGCFQDLVTHREILMMRVINSITDKPEWHQKVFDHNIVSNWREEIAKSGQDVTERMMDWIIKELQWKAGIAQKKGLVRVFDIGVTKSDTAISKQLQQDLKRAVVPFEDVPEDQKDYHPGSGEKVVNLVHPSLFPVIFGRTRVLPDRTIDLKNCLSSVGQGILLQTPTEEDTKIDVTSRSRDKHWEGKAFSRKFQWLPCDVAFRGLESETSDTDKVHQDEHHEIDRAENDIATNNHGCKIKSYINNAHPIEHRPLYDAVERVIAAAIPLWDETLTEWPFEGERIPYKEVKYGEHSSPEPQYPEDAPDDFDDDAYGEKHWAWLQSRPIILPEPGEFEVFKTWDCDIVNLREQFSEKGLQVIVKLANIELTPEKPEYEGGTWHIEGQLNERICATAIYYYDNQNITDSRLSFRQRGDRMDDVIYDQDCHEFLQDVYGLTKNEQTGLTETTQVIGGVVCREGRLVAFPNVVQHKVSPLSLADRSKSGHRKILALFLVDPHRRIISSANVPPQQENWKAKAGELGKVGCSHGLETEPSITPDQDGLDSTMTIKEAKAYRLELMEERSVAGLDSKRMFEEAEFHLCEH